MHKIQARELKRRAKRKEMIPKRKRGFMMPWMRDGYESALHYVADHRKMTLLYALRDGNEDHPYRERAEAAFKEGLIS